MTIQQFAMNTRRAPEGILPADVLRMSAGTPGRPTRRHDFQRQYRGNPLRFQRRGRAALGASGRIDVHASDVSWGLQYWGQVQWQSIRRIPDSWALIEFSFWRCDI
jgi:hypothetical protein